MLRVGNPAGCAVPKESGDIVFGRHAPIITVIAVVNPFDARKASFDARAVLANDATI